MSSASSLVPLLSSPLSLSSLSLFLSSPLSPRLSLVLFHFSCSVFSVFVQVGVRVEGDIDMEEGVPRVLSVCVCASCARFARCYDIAEGVG